MNHGLRYYLDDPNEIGTYHRQVAILLHSFCCTMDNAALFTIPHLLRSLLPLTHFVFPPLAQPHPLRAFPLHQIRSPTDAYSFTFLSSPLSIFLSGCSTLRWEEHYGSGCASANARQFVSRLTKCHAAALLVFSRPPLPSGYAASGYHSMTMTPRDSTRTDYRKIGTDDYQKTHPRRTTSHRSR